MAIVLSRSPCLNKPLSSDPGYKLAGERAFLGAAGSSPAPFLPGICVYEFLQADPALTTRMLAAAAVAWSAMISNWTIFRTPDDCGVVYEAAGDRCRSSLSG